MPGNFKEILRDKHLYATIPSLKLEEIRFFLDKMKEVFQKIDIFHPKENKTLSKVTQEDLYQTAKEVSFYASAFFSAVIGFLDTLAIFHTKNREQVYDKVHFKSWLDCQVNSHSDDDYLKYLKEEDDRWISHFRKNRNRFIHHSHPFISIETLQKIELKEGTLKIETFVTNLESDKKELLPYCEEIVGEIGKLISEINKNFEKEYEFTTKDDS